MSLIEERRDGAHVITFARPEARNALSRETVTALVAALGQAADDERVRAIVLAANGPVFLAGGDLKELAALPADRRGADHVISLGRSLMAIEEVAVPVIAAVAGDVFGGGAELLTLCDMVLMEAHATQRFVHAKMGLVPAWGGTTRLCERVGDLRAAALLMSAEPIAAERAVALGLANEVVPEGAALTRALAVVSELSQQPRSAITAIKASLLASRRARRGTALTDEAEVFRGAWGSPANLAALARVTK